MYSHNYLEELFIEKYPDSAVLIIVLGCLVCALIGYFIGSINCSIIISRLFFKDDIRSHGSGNAGSTNMLRTHGTLSGFGTLFCDFIKAAICVVAGALIYNITGAYIAGFFCIIGHILPVYFKFKGGKGVATVAIVIALTSIKTFAVLLAVFVITVIISKYVSLGSIVAVIMYPGVLFGMLKLEGAACIEYIGIPFAVLIAALVVFKHRSNIKKIINHNESKLSFTKHGTEDKEKE